MTTGRTFTLNTGAVIPALGLGTWQSGANEVYEAVLVALKAGYRHIDTAYVYGNEAEVGKAIIDSGIPREDIFLTTKLWGTYHTDPEANLDISLKKLGLDYVDLYLVHWPSPLNPKGNHPLFPTLPDGSRDRVKGWDFVKTWELVQKLPATGKTKAVGVSNFSTVNLEKLLTAPTTKIVPAVNQVELHPYLPQHKLLAYAKAKGIHITAYSPLGSTNAPLQQEPAVQEIAARLGKSPTQVLISWAISRGTSVIPKSVTSERIIANFDDFVLDDKDIAAVDAISNTTAKRLVNPNWGEVVFHDD
ncbi:NADP-dependent oxidoreductase domain-containing protein [Lipomyces tetrasporus]|uniref:NADP-dependent oxidoreductase domain-containing protein n=1 Tax=Lipomyces tetrasporus TaxID=54092 RepID=A0AAD7QN22_9ASCO|nr:NADP-dependent oxidoreductase domain-containing protein [Lipomyces tetrasporus]KAJ8098010.1 NADP-dependent oxidoreductase domain-containing protein [Lipomyces tetrasporus]